MPASYWMFATAVGLLVIALICGAAMVGFLFVGNTRPPLALGLVHGVSAVAAVTLALSATLMKGATRSLAAAIVALLLAVAAGLRLLTFHLRNRPVSPSAVGTHALLALAGFVGLVLALLQ